MADTKTTDLATLTGAAAAATDLAMVVDVSDTSMAASGTNKGMQLAELAIALIALGNVASDAEVAAAISALSAVYQPLDSDLTAVAGLSPSNDDILQRKAGAWTNRTIAQLLTDLNLDATYATDADLTAHIGDATDAHDASAISILDSANDFTATDVEAALAELQADHEADVTALAGYLPLVAAGANVENVGAIESDVSTNGSTGSTETLDTSDYAIFDMTMDQACTFTFSNPAPSGDNSTFMLILRGAFTPTFPASVDWSDATPPTYTTPSVYIFTTVDAGTTWLGQSVGKAFG
jgi:hypothetical protein